MLNASKHEARPKISSPNPLRRIRRAVEDYDFDRLEVEAQQCVELTSTNRPFGLIIKLAQTVDRSRPPRAVLEKDRSHVKRSDSGDSARVARKGRVSSQLGSIMEPSCNQFAVTVRPG